MDFLTLSKKRYSVRSYADTPVSEQLIEKLLLAAQHAPTAHNNQPQIIYVMRSKEALDIVDASTRARFGAPLVFVVCYDTELSWKSKDGRDSGIVDASIVATHILLEATDLGLGSVWVGLFKPDVLKEKLELPENIIPVCVLPIGYASDTSVPLNLHDQRRPLSETVRFL
jgi:nitroreductase